ncbi:MAG: HD domain-containing protein [Peptostreptococcaceae bacterium]
MKEKFIELLRSTGRENIENVIEWLGKTDFFIAPASTKFHGNYESGLVEHCLNVYELFKEKVARYNLDVPEDSAIIATLLHDVCKCNVYKVQERWRKDHNNKWEAYYPYVFEDSLPLGHGEKSVILLQTKIRLTALETFLIRFHMGGFLEGNELKSYHQATNLYPAIVAMHTADYEAGTYLEKKVEI